MMCLSIYSYGFKLNQMIDIKVKYKRVTVYEFWSSSPLIYSYARKDKICYRMGRERWRMILKKIKDKLK